MKHDIQSRLHIEQLVNAFYEKVKTDDVIGYIFNDVRKVNWETHLPVMYQFWDNAIFYSGGYFGNPLKSHQSLHSVAHLRTEHFQRWIQLFVQTVNELFKGERAEVAKQRAISIATVMEIKILPKKDSNTNV
jgi:hemoglobin